MQTIKTHITLHCHGPVTPSRVTSSPRRPRGQAGMLVRRLRAAGGLLAPLARRSPPAVQRDARAKEKGHAASMCVSSGWVGGSSVITCCRGGAWRRVTQHCTTLQLGFIWLGGRVAYAPLLLFHFGSYPSIPRGVSTSGRTRQSPEEKHNLSGDTWYATPVRGTYHGLPRCKFKYSNICPVLYPTRGGGLSP